MIDVRELVADATRRLQAAGVPGATADARWLVSGVLGTSPAGLLFAGPISDDEVAAVEAAVRRRERREPLQHILGTAPFGDLELSVGPGVFVPRPETEVMAQHALDWLRSRPRRPVVVDACSGSGALALAVACHVPADVSAIEVSGAAQVFLERNVERLRPRFTSMGAAVRIVVADATERSAWPAPGSVDLVVSNPPYIPADCVPREPEVRDHDPEVALYGGRDGFDVVRPLVRHAASVLRRGGLLLVEHSDEQGGADGVPGIVIESGAFREVTDHRDHAGRPRFTAGLRV